MNKPHCKIYLNSPDQPEMSITVDDSFNVVACTPHDEGLCTYKITNYKQIEVGRRLHFQPQKGAERPFVFKSKIANVEWLNPLNI